VDNFSDSELGFHVNCWYPSSRPNESSLHCSGCCTFLEW